MAAVALNAILVCSRLVRVGPVGPGFSAGFGVSIFFSFDPSVFRAPVCPAEHPRDLRQEAGVVDQSSDVSDDSSHLRPLHRNV